MPCNSHFTIRKLMINTLVVFSYASTIQKPVPSVTCPENSASQSIDALLENYIVISQTRDVAKWKWFFMPEYHDNQTHHYWQASMVNALGKPGDRVLFESLPYDKNYPCNQICYQYKDKDKHGGAQLIDVSTNQCVVKFNYSSELICQGWAEEKLLKAASEMAHHVININDRGKQFNQITATAIEIMNRYYQKLNLLIDNISESKINQEILIKETTDLYDTIIELQKTLKQMPHFEMLKLLSPTKLRKALKQFKEDNSVSTETMIELLQEHLNAMFKISKKLDLIGDRITAEKPLNEDYDKTAIVERNEVIISMMKFYATTKNRFFVFLGHRHLLPEFEKPYKNIQSNDPQYRLHQAAQGEDCVTLVPKL